MDENELNEWIKSEAGAEWLEQQKAPLLKKKDELLSEVKRLGERLTEESQRATDTEKLLQDERAALHTHVVDGELDRLMDEYNVSPKAREAVRSAMKSSHDITLSPSEADGKKRVAMIDSQTKLADHFAQWAESDEAKFYRVEHNTGGGATGVGTPETGDESSRFQSEVLKAMGV